MKYLVSLIAIILMWAPLAVGKPSDTPEGISLVEKVKPKAGEIVIPYEKYVMDNGLTVILHEDKSDPIVHVDITYKVGSANEDIGKSGFAHFFEHMMFQGSQHVADEQHFKIITEAGGTLNGTTSRDRTNYFQTIPSNQLEKILWLESDRMGFLLPAVSQKKFEIQRAAIKNERLETFENRPYGVVEERIGEAMFPEGHPYSWVPIGYVEDLDRVNVSDLKEFFLKWYGPNNATLTIGGDFDTEQTLEWVKKYFGSIPSGPEVKPVEKALVKLEKDRYISMEDNVQLPLLVKSTPTVYARHPDEAALNILASVLGRGRTSLLYKNLIETRLAIQADASHRCGEIACTFEFSMMPNSGATTLDMQRGIRKSLKKLEKRGITEQDLTRFKKSLVSEIIFSFQSVSSKVATLAYLETFAGDPKYITKALQDFEDVTADDVMRVYKKYIKNKPSVIMRVMPEGKGDSLGIPDTWKFSGRTLPEYTTMSDADLSFRVAKDDFDRSIMPKAGPAPQVTLPNIWQQKLKNGIEVLGALNAETPTTNVVIQIKTGQQHDPYEKLGLASLTASLMNEATVNSSAEQLSTQLESIGASVSVSSGTEYTLLSISALTKHFDEAVAIAVEKLFEPKFSQVDFDRTLGQITESLKQAGRDPEFVAGTVLSLLLYGEENNFAHPNVGSEQTLNTIVLDDVREFYEKHYSPQIADIIVISNLQQQEVMKSLEPFSSWKGGSVAQGEIKPYPELQEGTIYFVDQPGAEQSEVRVAKRSVTYDVAGEHYKLKLLSFPFGGAFNSRLNLNIREDKGYTYGITSVFSANEYKGEFIISSAVRADATAASIAEIFSELKGYYKEGMTKDEFDFMQSAVTQDDVLGLETPSQKINFLARIFRYDLDPSFPEQQTQLVKSVKRKELNSLIKKHLDPESMITLVVGDKSKVLKGLQKLGMPVVELDQSGRTVSR
ncbi:pitrilysin family protein [Porticoccus sp. W117]|uniref:M16 family metallopeptidase n=1 Tax=Porticoccus sp. W117 TaxID=3054777 RepID=UPI002594B27E|nr:pitrilysin family protein [Porticoccus sp. W117]MDM3872149.1 pitrilysin family protein [Porticoccus sp. W117]